MNRDFGINLDEVIKSVDSAEVISIFFPRFRKSLVIDTRFTMEDSPLIKIMPMVNSVEERLRSIRRMRRNFPRAVNITLIPWLGHVDGLIHMGIWDRIVNRFVDSAQKDAIKACADELEKLKRLEIEETASAIRGDEYYTLWSRVDG